MRKNNTKQKKKSENWRKNAMENNVKNKNKELLSPKAGYNQTRQPIPNSNACIDSRMFNVLWGMKEIRIEDSTIKNTRRALLGRKGRNKF